MQRKNECVKMSQRLKQRIKRIEAETGCHPFFLFRLSKRPPPYAFPMSFLFKRFITTCCQFVTAVLLILFLYSYAGLCIMLWRANDGFEPSFVKTWCEYMYENLKASRRFKHDWSCKQCYASFLLCDTLNSPSYAFVGC